MTPERERLLFFNDVERQWLIEFACYQPGTGETNQYFSTHGFSTAPTDPVHTHYAARIADNLVFERSMYQGGSIGGESVPGFGTVTLVNNDGGLDYLADWSLGGYVLTLKLGTSDSAYADFEIVQTVVMQEPEPDDEELLIVCQDFHALLQNELAIPRYGGTGGDDGGLDLAEQFKPVLLGAQYDIEPVYLGVINGYHHWQFHHGPVAPYDAAFHRCFDAGVELIYKPGLIPAVGEWCLDESNGQIIRSAAASGILTCHVKGDATGSYVDSTAYIARRLIQQYTTISDIDDAGIELLHTAQPATVGIYLRNGGNALDVLDSLFNGIWGYYGFNRAGQFNVGLVELPDDVMVPEISLDASRVFECIKLRSPIPHWKCNIRYARRNTEITNSAQLTDQRRQFLAREYRVASVENATIKQEWAESTPLDINSHFLYQADAQAEAQRRFDVVSVKRTIADIETTFLPFLTDINDTVSLSFPRYDFDTPQNFRVITIAEEPMNFSARMMLWR